MSSPTTRTYTLELELEGYGSEPGALCLIEYSYDASSDEFRLESVTDLSEGRTICLGASEEQSLMAKIIDLHPYADSGEHFDPTSDWRNQW